MANHSQKENGKAVEGGRKQPSREAILGVNGIRSSNKIIILSILLGKHSNVLATRCDINHIWNLGVNHK